MEKVPVKVILWRTGCNLEYVDIEAEPAKTYHRWVWNICQELGVKRGDLLYWWRIFSNDTTKVKQCN